MPYMRRAAYVCGGRNLDPVSAGGSGTGVL
jgi:hypothetical protein